MDTQQQRIENIAIAGIAIASLGGIAMILFYDALMVLIERFTMLGTMACIIALCLGGILGIAKVAFYILVASEQFLQLHYETAKRKNELSLAIHDTSNGTIIIQDNSRITMYNANNQARHDTPLLLAGDTTLDDATNENYILDVLANDDELPSKHMLVAGGTGSGKSTLVNRLMAVEFSGYAITLIDDMLHETDSNWLMPPNGVIKTTFVDTLREFHASHMKVKESRKVSRYSYEPKLLVIDEVPTWLANLKATDKPLLNEVMAMLRAIYSQGSHTRHGLILLTQDSQVSALGVSTSDKTNFACVYLNKQVSTWLKFSSEPNKKQLMMRYERLRQQHKYIALIDVNGDIAIEPMPNLAKYGAKANYGKYKSVMELPTMPSATDTPPNERDTTLAGDMALDDDALFANAVIDAITNNGDIRNGDNSINYRALWKVVKGNSYGGKQHDKLQAILERYHLS